MTVSTQDRPRIAIDCSEVQRRQLRIEAMERGMSLREYVQRIFDRRHELEIEEEEAK